MAKRQRDGEASYRIREARSDDGEAIRSLVSGVLKEYGLTYEPSGADRDLGDPANEYLRRGGLFLIVLGGDGKIVGCSGLYPLDDKVAEIRKMYLLAEARGVGLGRRLLDTMIETARRRGFQELVLETASVLKEAMQLYERTGFSPVPHQHRTGRCDRTYCLRLQQES